jgi:hypothetical protein
MTLDEAINDQFKNIDDLESVKVRVHCILTVPTRGGQYSKCFFRDVIQFDGSKIHLKLLPHYSCYKNWKVSKNTVSPAVIKPDNKFECCIEKPVSEIVDMSLGKMFREIDISGENF